MSNQSSTMPINARVPSTLVASARELLSTEESFTDFVRMALENEISRRSLCKPKKSVSLDDLYQRLVSIQSLIVQQEATTRLISTDQSLIKSAIGI